MEECFLHFLWEQGLVFNDKVAVSQDFQFELIDRGLINHNAGPDFWNVKIRTDNLLLVGNVEIHVHADDWYVHQHHQDPAYDNVILHVVWQSGGRDTYTSSGRKVPVLVMSVDPAHLQLYQSYKESPCTFACQHDIAYLDSHWFSLSLPDYAIQRVMRKKEEVEAILQHCNEDYEQAFYIMLARAFGLKVNVLPFEMLAKSLPLKYLQRQAVSREDVEALLFGQSGILSSAKEEDMYVSEMKQRYRHFQRKYSLHPLDGHVWKYGRLRPSNFPDIRIAQFSSLVFQKESRLASVLDNLSVQYLSNVFQVSASAYWDDHYRLGKLADIKKKKYYGESSVYNILINAIIPFLFSYADRKGDHVMREKALALLEDIPAENNRIIRQWKEMQVLPVNALESQALLEIFNNYCRSRRCLDCKIGSKLFILKMSVDPCNVNGNNYISDFKQ